MVESYQCNSDIKWYKGNLQGSIVDLQCHIIKDSNGKIIKAILNDEGEHYELIKTK